ncbi:MAG: hypothetical protein U9O87_04830, partial [Verrucomicrobiota bacterium]|nr:hypothetical protein [Verrucomicrobiota bacterium]
MKYPIKQILFVIFFLTLEFSVFALQLDYEDLTITLAEDYNQVPSHGYLALSFNIHNTSLSEAKKIEFNLGYRNIARKTIVVPPRSITAMPV